MASQQRILEDFIDVAKYIESWLKIILLLTTIPINSKN